MSMGEGGNVSAIREEDEPLKGDDEYEYEPDGRSRGGGCFDKLLFCFKGGRGNRFDRLQGTWLGEKLKKMKQFSEMTAGPRWKNFIRTIGVGKKRRNLFQYSPESYAMNFEDDHDHVHRDYLTPPIDLHPTDRPLIRL